MFSRHSSLRTIQTISLAIISGTVIFLAVVVMLKLGQPTVAEFSPLAIVGVIGAVGGVFASYIIPKMIQRARSQQIAATNAVRTNQAEPSQAIVASVLSRFAILEGVALLNLFVFLLEGNWISMIVGLVLMAWMAYQFPTRQRLENALS